MSDDDSSKNNQRTWRDWVILPLRRTTYEARHAVENPDYDLAISKMNSEVFRASSKTGQPLLHTAEGIVKIPYKFDQEGQYSVQITVMGINFIPIKTEQSLFDLKVS